MKIHQYMVLGALLFTMSSCGNDWLNLEPSTSMPTDKAIQELSDVKFTLNGVYNVMQNAHAYSGRLVYYGDATGDDMQAVSVTKRTGNYYLFNFTKDNSPTTFWSYPYGLIATCNLALDKIDNINTTATDLRDAYKGEALALRGMFLFDLTRFYGYPYKKDNGASLGVPIVTKVLDKEAKPDRNTVAECYKQVISDLTDAAKLMNNKEGLSYKKGHISRWAVLTLLSRVYLYHGDDALALAAAEEAIEGAEADRYTLWTNEQYPLAWADNVSPTKRGEVLFEIINITDDSPGKESLGYLHNGSGYSDIVLTGSFYKLFTADKNDVRNRLISLSGKRGYINKYQPQEGENIKDANIFLVRLSETYLNAAEAAVKTGDNAKAVKYLDAIVKRANPAKTVNGTTVTLDQVMTERRKELVGEGHRMFDALRDGGFVHREKVTVSAISKVKHLTMNEKYMNFNWDMYKCVLPIPKAERDANPNIKQNPQYDVE